MKRRLIVGLTIAAFLAIISATGMAVELHGSKPTLAVKQPTAEAACAGLPTGCVQREKPPSDRVVAVWWADSAYKAKYGPCKDDWVVTYNTNTPGWVNANPLRYRYYGAGWSSIGAWWAKSQAYAGLDNQLPGIKLCLSGWHSYNDVRYGSYVWLTP